LKDIPQTWLYIELSSVFAELTWQSQY